MIKAFGINKFYGDLHVLKDVNIVVKEGEMISIVGASGAGKTTLLQILGTLDRASNELELKRNKIDIYSDLIIDNVEINKLKDKELSMFRNENIGFIFQFHHLLPEFTALENVCIPAFIKKENKKKAEKRAKELLDFLNLSSKFNNKPSQMSGGEQQRVSVARALINNPKVIFADEPSGSLDSKNSDELHKLFLQLKKDFKKTFIIVTHNERLANIADRKLEMKDGRIYK